MAAHDWSTFTCKIDINAIPVEIYKVWTTPADLESWFLRKASFVSADGQPVKMNDSVKVGDTYTWFWHGYPDDVLERGKVLEANGSDTFQFTFGGPCKVTVKLKQEEGVTIVELVQSQIPLDEESLVKMHLGCLSGWTFYLANLKSHLEGGIDLRNKNEKLRGMMNS